MRISMRLGAMLMILLGLSMLVPAPLSVVSAHTEEVELQRRVDEIRREIDEKVDREFARVSEELVWRDKSITGRSKSVDWWLAGIAVFQGISAIFIAVAAVLGYSKFQQLKTEANDHVAEVKKAAEEAQEHLKDIQDTSAQVAAISDSILRADKRIDVDSRKILEGLSDESEIARTDST